MMAKQLPKYHKVNLPKTLRQAYEAALNDPDIDSLKQELALQRAMLARAMEILEKQIDGTNVDQFKEAVGLMTHLMKEIRDTNSAIAAIEGKLNLHVDIRMFPTIIGQMVNVIKSEIKDDRILKRVSEQLGSISIDGRGGGAATVDKPRAGRRLLGKPA
jgi:hypothetical protein